MLAVVLGDGEPLVMVVPPGWLGAGAAIGGVPGAAELLVPVPAGVPLPSVPAPPDWFWPPVSTVLLAEMSAWRNGCTPSEMLAMTAIPASTATGRIQLTLTRGRLAVAGRPGWGSRSSRGQDRAMTEASEGDQAQWPRQVQLRSRS